MGGTLFYIFFNHVYINMPIYKYAKYNTDIQIKYIGVNI